jgi:hypothetical protein
MEFERGSHDVSSLSYSRKTGSLETSEVIGCVFSHSVLV